MPLQDGTATTSTTQHAAVSHLELPSLEQLTSDWSSFPSSLARGTETVDPKEQKEMFQALQDAIQNSDTSETAGSFDLKELHASLGQANTDARRGRDVESLKTVRSILYKLWSCNSQHLNQATEILANGSRDPSWRSPYGQSGILKFFLGVISSKDDVDTDLLLHSLRLVGNSCADTDENREIVVKDNYTLAIIRHFLNPDLIHVAIPVIYNVCMDFEPALSQMAANQTAYILLSLLKGDAIKGNDPLLGFSYDLIELATEAPRGLENVPNGAILLLIQLAVDKATSFAHYSSLVNCLSTYLEKERFQNACVSNDLVPGALEVLQRSFSVNVDPTSTEDTQTLDQLRLKINQSLAEVSASPLFAEHYPLDSALAQTLKSWVIAKEDQLQICACVMLGNLARSDKNCEVMVRELKIHEELISVLENDARGAVLHSALGFLKNLAIAGDNRLFLGEAGIIPAVSRLWAYDSVPQVQFSAVSITRQVIISSMGNISRLLAFLDSDSDHTRTYLSLLLSLFEKSDSAPIKTEIGRTLASICRTLALKARDSDEKAISLLDRLYTSHEGVAHPIGAMITQSQWPVVRSEGWFALALMASNHLGCVAVVDCLQNTEVLDLLKKTMSTDQDHLAELDQGGKDRDNIFVLAQEMLKNRSGALPQEYRSMMEDVVKDHASRCLDGRKDI